MNDYTLCRETVINFFLDRQIASKDALGEYFREILSENAEMKEQVLSLVGMTESEMESMLFYIRTCQLEELEELLRSIPESVKPTTSEVGSSNSIKCYLPTVNPKNIEARV